MTLPAVADGVIHLLVIPYPARGHSLAACQLARKFVRDGVRITLVDLFSDMAAEHLDICATEGIHVAKVGPADADRGALPLPYLKLVESVEGETEQLIASLSQPVTCIISDFFLGWTQVQ